MVSVDTVRRHQLASSKQVGGGRVESRRSVCRLRPGDKQRPKKMTQKQQKQTTTNQNKTQEQNTNKPTTNNRHTDDQQKHTDDQQTNKPQENETDDKQQHKDDHTREHPQNRIHLNVSQSTLNITQPPSCKGEPGLAGMEKVVQGLKRSNFKAIETMRTNWEAILTPETTGCPRRRRLACHDLQQTLPVPGKSTSRQPITKSMAALVASAAARSSVCGTVHASTRAPSSASKSHCGSDPPAGRRAPCSPQPIVAMPSLSPPSK